jgi:predicted RNase H-like nuclease (RuvC/YqgF family)
VGGVGKDSSAISRAIDEVRQIVASLEQVLEQMEEVRELVELAERQKSADEREIESLRRALRRIQSPRGHKGTPPERGSD